MKHTYRRRISAAALLALMISSSVAQAITWPARPEWSKIKPTEANAKKIAALTIEGKAPKVSIFNDKNRQIAAAVTTVLAILVNHMAQSATNELMTPDSKDLHKTARSKKHVLKDIALAMINPRKLAKVGLGSLLAVFKKDSRDVTSTVGKRLYAWFMDNKVFMVLSFAEFAGAMYFIFNKDGEYAHWTNWKGLETKLKDLIDTQDLELKPEVTLAGALKEKAALTELAAEEDVLGTGKLSVLKARKAAREALVVRAETLGLTADTATAQQLITAALLADVTAESAERLTAEDVDAKLQLLSLLSDAGQKELEVTAGLLTARKAALEAAAAEEADRVAAAAAAEEEADRVAAAAAAARLAQEEADRVAAKEAAARLAQGEADPVAAEEAVVDGEETTRARALADLNAKGLFEVANQYGRFSYHGAVWRKVILHINKTNIIVDLPIVTNGSKKAFNNRLVLLDQNETWALRYQNASGEIEVIPGIEITDWDLA